MNTMNLNPSNKVIVKQLQTSYADEAVANELYEIASAGYGGQSPWTVNQIFQTLEASNTTIFVASIGQEKIGLLAASETPFELDIYMVVVSKQYKRKNVGTQLFEAMFTYAKEKEINEILLEVRESNIPARALYERVGFEKVGRRKAYYSSPIEDAVVMKHEIGKGR